MQTEYKLLYRFVNGTTNTPITDEAPYEKTEEFYSSEHKVNLTSAQLSTFASKTYELKYKTGSVTDVDYAATMNKEANEEREALVTSNMANENKSNNLYVYTGTTKQFHKQFIPEQLGYVVRDWTKVPENQIPNGPNDYSKHFVMLGGQKLGVDDAYLVCKPQFMATYQKIWDFKITTANQNDKSFKNNTLYYHQHSKIDNFTELINEVNFFEWTNPFKENLVLQYGETAIESLMNYSQVSVPSGDFIWTWYLAQGGQFPTLHYYLFVSDAPFNMPATASTLNGETTVSVPSGGGTYHGAPLQSFITPLLTNTPPIYVAETITFNKSTIVRAVIPEHYEDTGKPPYIIKDQYEKIELSPWMLHSIHHSLESGLEMAKKLVGMLGIDNVKLIKNVPIDQFVKIK